MLQIDEVETRHPEEVGILHDMKRALFFFNMNLLQAQVDHLDTLARAERAMDKQDHERNAKLISYIFSLWTSAQDVLEYCPASELNNVTNLLNMIDRVVIQPFEEMKRKGH